jgi:uncharacterized tellurite resistance protein B-like protein
MLSMPRDDRAELLAILAQMVISDDVVSATEVKFLEQVYTMLGVDLCRLDGSLLLTPAGTLTWSFSP